MNTPILYLAFNRPDLVKKTFLTIQGLQPKYLYVSVDGPRQNNLKDIQRCAEVKSTILEMVNWECDVKYLFRNKNKGCGAGVSEAISWFFKYVEEGIILEDDCLPDITFFPFCEELLRRYRENKKVYHISGSNWQEGRKRGEKDYYFSNFPAVWGWATWRDRWEQYNLNIIDSAGLEIVSDYLDTSGKITVKEKEYHLKCFILCKSKKIDTWDYQWRFLIHLHQGVSITPNKNLISNIGHREDGTHTTDYQHWRANLKSAEIEFPLNHPDEIKINYKADRFLIYKLLNIKQLHFVNRLNSILHKFFKLA